MLSRSRAIKTTLAVLALTAAIATVLAGTGRWPFAGTPAIDAAGDFGRQIASEIEGADLNRNGIRDDVEEWVREEFFEDAVERRAFLQLAGDYQRVLLTTSRVAESLRSLLQLSASLACVRQLQTSDAEVQIVRLKAVVLDTDVRVRAWLKAYDRLEDAGIDQAPPPASDCGFAE